MDRLPSTDPDNVDNGVTNLFIGWTSLALILPVIAIADAPADPREVAALVVDESNAFRQHEGLAKLTRNAKLAATAQEFADYMAAHDKLGHEADGRTPPQRVKAHGYDYCMVSENIAYQFRTRGFRSDELSHGLLDGWKRSPGHRKNLLDPDVVETGVAVARSRGGRYYAVQMFGRPASLAVEFTVANESPQRIEYRVGTRPFSLPPRTERRHADCVAEAVILDGRTVRPAKGERLAVR